MDRQKIHLVLRHDDVMGRHGQTIHSSVTQVDIHDFCRLCLTYGLGGFHVVTAMEAQHAICGEILDYWRRGPGKAYNPDRRDALDMLRLHRDFDSLTQMLEQTYREPPVLVGTSAKPAEPEKMLAFQALPPIIERSGARTLVQFGTAWGLSPEQLGRCDWVLPPIDGHDGYNHLSVRCAAAIIVDRLFSSQRINL